MKRSSITKFNKFFLGGLLLYIVPIIFTTLILVNTIDFDEPKGPYDPNENVTEPVFSDTIPSESKKPIKKKIKTLSSEIQPQKKVEVVSEIVPTPTIVNVIKNDSLAN